MVPFALELLQRLGIEQRPGFKGMIPEARSDATVGKDSRDASAAKIWRAGMIPGRDQDIQKERRVNIITPGGIIFQQIT